MKRKKDLAHPYRGSRLRKQEVADRVEQSILCGEFDIGDMVPAERDLAEHCNVSRVTVRAAIAMLEKEGLLQRIPRIGYKVVQRRRNSLRSTPIGLIVEGFSGPLPLPLRIESFERFLSESGRVLMLGVTACETERENICIQRLREAQVGGLIVTPARSGEASSELARWIDENRPVVLEGHPGAWRLPDRLVKKCSRVDVDNRDGIVKIMNYLLNLGHRRIGMLCGDDPKYSERLAAFREFAKNMDLPLRPEWIVTGLSRDRAGGYAGFRRLSERTEWPTAVLCTQDDMALGFMDAARSAGLACPDDLSVAGFANESASGPESLRELTTVGWSSELAVREMLARLDEQMLGNAMPRSTRIPVDLIVRNSCALPDQGSDRSRPGESSARKHQAAEAGERR